MDLKNFGLKLVGSSQFLLSKSLWNNWHTIVLTGMSMKPTNKINYILVECNSFLKSPSQMKLCLVIIYIQEQLSDSEEIIKDSMFQWRLFVIQKFMRSCMI